jgi:anti-sigma factor RsiW
MNCKNAKKMIPLAAGNDLSAKKAAAVRDHLEGCPDCRKEAAELEHALRAAKTLAGAERAGDWSEAEWRSLLRSVTAGGIQKKRVWAGLPLKPVLAGGLGLVFLAFGSFLLLKKSPAPVVTRAAFESPSIEQAAPKRIDGQPDVTSRTIVSKETGLKIIWFYNKNFQGDGFGK